MLTGSPVVVLSISGSDSSGGAGLQADLKTLQRHGVFGTTAVSLVTAQNSLGVQRYEVLAPEFVVAQARAVLEDYPVAAVKTGSLGSAGNVRAVGELLAELSIPIVVDPVMISKHGSPLVEEAAVAAFAEHLLPHATLATPNRHEAGRLVGRRVESLEEMQAAAEELRGLGLPWVLVTGGDRPGDGDAVDLLVGPGVTRAFVHRRVTGGNTHGTGCALSAAIAAHLARGLDPVAALERAIYYVVAAIERGPALGAGVGPLEFGVDPG
jgi:hydroxymethylpyrimidine/phosphomethylpyrimidine kinase